MPQTPPGTIRRVGSRGSKLARAQAELVRHALATKAGVETELVTVTTTGDRISDRPLADIGGKGLFAKELEEALLERRIDLAVHSMKDLPVEIPPGLKLVATPPRDDPADAFLSRHARGPHELSKGARVGTSSVRRAAQLLRLRRDLQIVPLRGNVDTRIAKLESGAIDAIILALAGLKRIGRQDTASSVLDPQEWLPALAQGALGIEMREEDEDSQRVSGAIDDVPTRIALACERAFQAALDGSCRTPIAGLATLDGDALRFRGEVLAPDGSRSEEIALTLTLGAAPEEAAARAGREAGLALKERARDWLVL